MAAAKTTKRGATDALWRRCVVNLLWRVVGTMTVEPEPDERESMARTASELLYRYDWNLATPPPVRKGAR